MLSFGGRIDQSSDSLDSARTANPLPIINGDRSRSVVAQRWTLWNYSLLLRPTPYLHNKGQQRFHSLVLEKVVMADVAEIIRDLASTRADCFNGRKRHELMTVAIQSLQSSTQDRKILANRKGTLHHCQKLEP